MTVLGVDPGMATLGLVIRDGDRLVSHRVVTRPSDITRQEWIEGCLAEALKLTEPLHGLDLVAVEDVTTPNVWHHGRKQALDPTSSIETAAAAGAIIGWAWTDPTDVVLVPPGHNGGGHRWAYPAELWGPREGDAGTGRLRHCRSAWDVARQGLLIHSGRRVA